MKIHLVAPRTDLAFADAEVQNILRSGNEVTPVIGTITKQTFLQEVLASDAQMLYLCTHGNADGIMLSDGILKASQLTTAVRGRFDYVVLNTCNSFHTAQMLQNDTGAAIIATIIEVPDDEAFYTGAVFVQALAQLDDVGKAYDKARPGGNRTYIYLAGKKK